MTHTLDTAGRISDLDTARPVSAPASATQAHTDKFGTFVITFGISFALLYTVYERLNWPLFTYHPVSGLLEFGRVPTGIGPPMFWYGWIALAVISALIVSWIATKLSAHLLSRATVFCCVLAALWPTVLEAIRYYVVKIATYDADFLNSVWIAAVPAFVVTAAVTYFVPARVAERMWTSWLLIVPIVGLVVLGYSLQQYFVR
jgi:hypothetical protein